MKKIYLILFLLFSIISAKSQDQLNKVDLSSYCPYAKTQFKATCYAYAFAYTALSISYCVKNNITDRELVEANAFSPGFIASIHRKQSFFNPKCGMNGSYDVDIEIFQKYGCPKLKDFNEDCTTKIPNEVFTKSKEATLKEYKYIQDKQDTSKEAITNIKEILSKKMPVLIVLNMTDDFSKLVRDCNETLPVLKHEKKSKTAHDICIIGYDDQVGSKYFGRFLIKNNYEIWGDERNMAWVKYEDMMYMITSALYFTIN